MALKPLHFYFFSLHSRSETGSLLSTCNMGCNCQANIYKQICDTEGKKYFSPCLAGCSIKSNAKVINPYIISRILRFVLYWDS